MIRDEKDGAGSFAERLRASRQRLRTSDGRRWTQGDLAAAVGVERNTVSRWENGGILPKDPGVLAALARPLKVTTDWLLDGFAPASPDAVEPRSALKEGANAGRGYRPDPVALAAFPAGAADLVRGYLRRLSRAGCSPDQLRGAESILLAGAMQQVGSSPFGERSDAEILADVDAAWDFVIQVLRREGVRP
ncbi:MAG: helix-turn-helix domain-containing protein [Gemmatimonadaceae bacterium]